MKTKLVAGHGVVPCLIYCINLHKFVSHWKDHEIIVRKALHILAKTSLLMQSIQTLHIPFIKKNKPVCKTFVLKGFTLF